MNGTNATNRTNGGAERSGPAQAELPEMPRVRIRVPLVCVQTFGAGFTPDGPLTPREVMERIENGAHAEHIAWAFDIASKDAMDREVRVLSHLMAPTWRKVLAYGQSATLDSALFGLVLNLIFPITQHNTRSSFVAPKDRHVLGSQVQRAWSCHATHIATLLAEGELTEYREREVKSGPNGSPAITWDSITAFLKKRCLATNAERTTGT